MNIIGIQETEKNKQTTFVYCLTEAE